MRKNRHTVLLALSALAAAFLLYHIYSDFQTSRLDELVFILPEPNYNSTSIGPIHYAPPNPRVCSLPYCSLRYIPDNVTLSVAEKNAQWKAVSEMHSLKIIYESDLAKKSSRAWVTMLTGDKRTYISSAFVMAKAYRTHKTRYPIVLLVTESSLSFFSQSDTVMVNGKNSTIYPNKRWNAALYDLFDMIIQVPTLDRIPMNQWEKIFMLSLVQFDIITWIGSDTITLTNVDEMLDCIPPCSVFDEHLWRLSDIGPIVNGDVVVLKPSLQDFVNFLDISKDPEMGRPLPGGSAYLFNIYPPYQWFGPVDQGAINTYYSRYLTVFPKSYHLEVSSPVPLAEKNQLQSGLTKLIHFAAHSKPWGPYAGSLSTKAIWCQGLHEVWTDYGLEAEWYLCNSTIPL